MAIRMTFQNRLLLGCLVVVVCTLIFVTVVLQRSLRGEMMRQVEDEMKQRLVLLSEIVLDRYNPDDGLLGGDRLADALGGKLGARVTLISPAGLVLGDSDVPLAGLAKLDNHGMRPEVVEALEGGSGVSVRYSSTLDTDLMYAAKRLGDGTRPLMVVRLALSLSSVKKTLSQLQRLIMGAVLLGALLSLGMAYMVARGFSRPLKKMTTVATAIAAGDLQRRFRQYPGHEIGDLGRAFDRMADNMQARIDDITAARDRLEAMLRGMVEGVMVVDRDGRVMIANRALMTLLDLPSMPIGMQLSEFVRNPEVLDAIRQVRRGEGHVSTEFRTLSRAPRFLGAQVVRLPDSAPQAGAVAVFHDLTERKRLEEVRRDFVANVSHELRTPLTAIRGSSETLLGGALENQHYAKHFVEMIARNASRLERLTQDLLDLAAMESGREELVKEAIDGASLADSVLATVGELAEERGVELERELPKESLRIMASRRHLEQAVLNLLDNAIKYTESGGKVTLALTEAEGQTRISVKDSGAGIAPEHLGRIFERFYRADKDRSRQMGGTGLGLAIVKHIAQKHGGRVEVESTPGQGSTFTLVLPA
ncbi:ATP-binding protein [Desulfarculus baarsii]